MLVVNRRVRRNWRPRDCPALPMISSMPGWPRWNASFKAAHELIAESLGEMQDYFDDRSESWQESERGEDAPGEDRLGGGRPSMPLSDLLS